MSSITPIAAVRILTNIKTSYLKGLDILDIEGDTKYGNVDVIGAEVIRKNYGKSIAVVASGSERVIVGAEHKKTIRELASRKALPEGMVKFPTKDVFIIGVGSKMPVKESDKFLARLIPESITDITVEDGGFCVRNSVAGNEWFAVPFISSKRPNDIQWAVQDNDRDSKLALIFGKQEDAFERLRKLDAELSASIAKKAA